MELQIHSTLGHGQVETVRMLIANQGPPLGVGAVLDSTRFRACQEAVSPEEYAMAVAMGMVHDRY